MAVKEKNMAKPKCKLIGEDGNIFNLAGKVASTLKKADMEEEAKRMTEEVLASNSYNEALCILGNYVEIE